MKKIAIRLLLTFGALVLVAGFVVWWAWSIFSVKVVNRSGQMLHNVEVDLAGNVLHLGSLTPDARTTVYGTVGNKEYGSVSFERSGKKYRRDAGYLMTRQAQACTLMVFSMRETTLVCMSSLPAQLLFGRDDLTIDDGGVSGNR